MTQGNSDIAAVADVEIEVKVKMCCPMLHLHVERLRLGEPYFLMAAGHQLWYNRQLVCKEIGCLQSLGVEVEDIPLTCAGGY